jgi:shikimate dehydrogenase
MIGGRTRVFALLGDPVAHSLSPAIHNAAFRALGLDAVYVPIRCDEGAVPVLMRALAAANGGGNVTIPHKRVGAAVAAPVNGDPLVVCNTFWGQDGRLVGDETDSLGIIRAWNSLGRPPGDWLLLGTGGSAVGAALAARSLGTGVWVESRSPERAEQFRAELEAIGVPIGAGTVGFIVNCTPLGLGSDDPLPLEPRRLPAGAAVLDLVYRRGETTWVRVARDAGHPAADGREVLLGQAAAAFERWFPATPAPVEVMHAALARGLA